ncbi:hypothetical protein BCR34DRAFT_193874 [Clohesyomyces aquaticus]|uniref:Uncharacterized protein n=1 Tax=Clohesyomyces aquaticus TaxID=1231657 RepID=A0A1Y1YCJ4_9PLEO|nr:hypothetical protein BCR34DRAFT_193874 [Clohesyomyces aquaticus]
MSAQGEPPTPQSGQEESVAQVARGEASSFHTLAQGQHDEESAGDDVEDRAAPSHEDLGLQPIRATQLPTIKNLIQPADGVSDSQPQARSAQKDPKVPIVKNGQENTPLVEKEYLPSTSTLHEQGCGLDGALSGDSNVGAVVGDRQKLGSVNNSVIADPLDFWRRLVLRIYGPPPDDATSARINETEEAEIVLQAQRAATEQIAKKTGNNVKGTQQKPVPLSLATQSRLPLAFVGNWEGAVAYGRRVTEKPKWLPVDDETIEKILANPEPWI